MPKRTELKVFRVKQGLSQKQFAEKVGYNWVHYAKFENGTQAITMRFINALQEAFGLTLDEATKITKSDEKK